VEAVVSSHQSPGTVVYFVDARLFDTGVWVHHPLKWNQHYFRDCGHDCPCVPCHPSPVTRPPSPIPPSPVPSVPVVVLCVIVVCVSLFTICRPFRHIHSASSPQEPSNTVQTKITTEQTNSNQSQNNRIIVWYGSTVRRFGGCTVPHSVSHEQNSQHPHNVNMNINGGDR